MQTQVSVTPNLIQANNQAVVTLQLSIWSDGFCCPTLNSGTITLFSGNGASIVVDALLSGTSFDPGPNPFPNPVFSGSLAGLGRLFSAPFTYATPGSYTPYATGIFSISHIIGGGLETTGGPFSSCNFGQNCTNSLLTVNAGNGAAVPLPAALPLFVSGLVGMGWLARWKRRRQRSQQSL